MPAMASMPSVIVSIVCETIARSHLRTIPQTKTPASEEVWGFQPRGRGYLEQISLYIANLDQR